MLEGIGLVYLVILVLVSFIELITVSVENYNWSIVWLAVLVGFLKVSNLVSFASLPPLWILIVSYIALGLLWSIVKWIQYSRDWVSKNLKEVKKYRKDFCEKMGYTDFKKSYRDDFLKYLFSNYGVKTGKVDAYNDPIYIRSSVYWKSNILIKDNIDKIIFWAFFWPFGVLAFLLKEPITLFYRFLINKVFNPVYRAISQAALNILDKDE